MLAELFTDISIAKLTVRRKSDQSQSKNDCGKRVNTWPSDAARASFGRTFTRFKTGEDEEYHKQDILL